jgi:ATP-binding cassette, subfamily B, bacterial
MGWIGLAAVDEDDRLTRKESRRIGRRVLAMLRPHRREMAATFLVMVLATGCLLSGPALVAYGIDHGIKAHKSGPLDAAAIAYLVVAVAALILSRAQIRMVTRLGERFLRDLRVRVFNHIQAMSMEFFDGEKTGRLVSRMTADINALEDLVQQGLLLFVTNGLLILIAIVVLVVMSPVLFALSLVGMPVLIWSSRRFQKDSNRAYLDVRDRISQTLSTIQEGISGVRVIQAFARERAQEKRFADRNRAQLDANIEAVRISVRYFPVVEAIGVFTTAVLVGLGGLLVHVGWVQVGVVIAFILYLANLFDPIQQMSQLYNLVQQSGAALNKLFTLLDVTPTVREHPGAVDLPPRGRIEISGVSFAYAAPAPDGSSSGDRLSAVGPLVLKDVDLVVENGERLALVGPTGAGKSTLAKLVARFYDPVEGRVSFGGTDLSRATLSSLRRRMVVVPQEGFLFSGTVMDNVRLGRVEATDEEVRAALGLIGAGPRFDALPEGLHTEVMERGSRLSAGERQLVSLARAALANPEVLVMDEATSSLDPGTEVEVEAAMGALMEGRTVIVIAHRLSTAERADRVAVVDHGRLVEVGTHAELMAERGRYAALFSSWAGERPPLAG